MFEDEIGQLLHGYVPAQAKVDLQCTHGQESVGETSSSFEKDDSPMNNFIDQQVEEFHMAESDERKSVVSDLSIEEDSMQGSPVLLSECDNVKSTLLDPDSGYGDQENLVLSPIKENSAAEITWNEENRVLNPNVLMSSEQSLHKEVVQSAHEQQDENFVQVKKIQVNLC